MVMRWKCPHCEASCRIRGSESPQENYGVVYLQCTNPTCGWTGKGNCEIIRTLTPSHFGSPSDESSPSPCDSECPTQQSA